MSDARQIIALDALRTQGGERGCLRRRRLPLVSEAAGGAFVVLAGGACIEAARAAGRASVEAVVIERLPLAFADLARRLAAGDLPAAELADAVDHLVHAHGVGAVADGLGLSAPHVRNLARLRRSLVPEAWAAFAAEGPRASLRWWLALAALPDSEQATRATRRGRPRRRSNRVLEQKRREMAPNDLRARVLGWVLGVEDFPRVPCGAFMQAERGALTTNRS